MEGVFEEGPGVDNPCRKKLNAFWRATSVIGETLDNVLEAIVVKVKVNRIVCRPIDGESFDQMPGDRLRAAIDLRNLLIQSRHTKASMASIQILFTDAGEKGEVGRNPLTVHLCRLGQATNLSLHRVSIIVCTIIVLMLPLEVDTTEKG